ncbi:hypothetical protein Pelo_22 [Pelomyxa schiedti]|nr:hypothetical protein Pelo_22 [Pelomyxa schiedti]
MEACLRSVIKECNMTVLESIFNTYRVHLRKYIHGTACNVYWSFIHSAHMTTLEPETQCVIPREFTPLVRALQETNKHTRTLRTVLERVDTLLSEFAYTLPSLVGDYKDCCMSFSLGSPLHGGLMTTETRGNEMGLWWCDNCHLFLTSMMDMVFTESLSHYCDGSHSFLQEEIQVMHEIEIFSSLSAESIARVIKTQVSKRIELFKQDIGAQCLDKMLEWTHLSLLPWLEDLLQCFRGLEKKN